MEILSWRRRSKFVLEYVHSAVGVNVSSAGWVRTGGSAAAVGSNEQAQGSPISSRLRGSNLSQFAGKWLMQA